MATPLTYLETLVRETQKPGSEVIALAFQAGLRQLWRERILGRYLRGEIPRAEAIKAAGIDGGRTGRTPVSSNHRGLGMDTEQLYLSNQE